MSSDDRTLVSSAHSKRSADDNLGPAFPLVELEAAQDEPLGLSNIERMSQEQVETDAACRPARARVVAHKQKNKKKVIRMKRLQRVMVKKNTLLIRERIQKWMIHNSHEQQKTANGTSFDAVLNELQNKKEKWPAKVVFFFSHFFPTQYCFFFGHFDLPARLLHYRVLSFDAAFVNQYPYFELVSFHND